MPAIWNVGKHNAPALLVGQGVGPLERQVLAVAGLVEAGFIPAVAVVAIPRAAKNLPVLVDVLRAEAGVHDEDRRILRLLGGVDVRVVGVRERHVRTERQALADLEALRTVDEVSRGRHGSRSKGNRRNQ